MARKKRIKLLNEKAYYHVFSRTVGKEFLLDSDEKKEFFIKIIERLSKFFAIKVKSFVVMSNHFHAILETCPEKKFSDEELIERAKKANLFKSLVLKKEINKLRKKINDISEFMKLLKQIFAQWYNKKYNRTGYFWGERFKSILIQPGIHLLRCIIYILLNPVRAKMVKSPDKYKFSSLYKINKKYKKLIHKLMENKILENYKNKNLNLYKNDILGNEDFIKKVKKLTFL